MPAAVPPVVRSTVGAVRYYLAGIWKRANEVPVFIWAQAIAFKVLVTILPLILIATGIFGLVLRQENPFDTVAGYLRTFLPAGQNESLVTLLYQLQEASSTITIFGGVFLFLTVITLFSALRYIIATAVGDRHTYRSILGGYAFDLRMVVQVGLLFLLSFALTFAINYVSTESTAVLARIGFDPDMLKRGWRIVLRVVSILVPYGISLLMFVQLFYFIPRPSPPSRSAFFGATVSAVLFEIAKNGFTLYATYTGIFNRYASGETDAALGGLGGIFGLLLAFVFWVYFSGLVLIIGAIMTGLHEHRHQPPRSRLGHFFRSLWAKQRPAPDAPAEDALDVAEPTAAPRDERAASPAGDGAATPATPAPESQPTSDR
ncbi:MAG: YhjD/YihY/BrkB family envelope integrity protein [Rhodothermales bacterium]